MRSLRRCHAHAPRAENGIKRLLTAAPLSVRVCRAVVAARATNPHSVFRYFADCERLLGVVPHHTVLDVCGSRSWEASEETRGLWSSAYPGAPCDIIALRDPAAAAAAMRASLDAVHGDWEARAVAAEDAMYDVAAAGARQAVFHYQVSLPHYAQQYFRERGICRCARALHRDRIGREARREAAAALATGALHSPHCRYLTFLRLRWENPGVKLCPTYDIDIVWHAHMANDPHGYKCETEALLGEHVPHDDSLNDRAADAPLAAVQAQTEAVFAGAGLRFSQPGSMYRGTPKLLTAAQRAQAMGGA